METNPFLKDRQFLLGLLMAWDQRFINGYGPEINMLAREKFAFAVKYGHDPLRELMTEVTKIGLALHEQRKPAKESNILELKARCLEHRPKAIKPRTLRQQEKPGRIMQRHRTHCVA